jgi:hypothetical protein
MQFFISFPSGEPDGRLMGSDEYLVSGRNLNEPTTKLVIAVFENIHHPSVKKNKDEPLQLCVNFPDNPLHICVNRSFGWFSINQLFMFASMKQEIPV